MKATPILHGGCAALLLIMLLVAEARSVNETRAQDIRPATESKEYIYKRTPQGELKVFVDFPPGWSRADTRPAIVFFHGGGWRAGSPQQFAVQAHYLAGRGIVALRAEYRLKNPHGVSPDKCVEDAKTAMRWVKAHVAELGIDPNKVISSGGSAGGHLAACVATTPGLDAKEDDLSVSAKPCAMVLFNPVLNLVGSERHADVVSSREVARAISPTLNLSQDTPPAIIFYGSEDQFRSMGEEYCTKAKGLGLRAEMYIAAGQKHGFFNRPPWRDTTLYETDRFLASLGYLAGEPTLTRPADGGALKRWAPR